MEHRWGRRITVEIPIQMVAQGSLRSGLVANLSVTGALIKADYQLRMLTRVQIFFESPTRPQKDALILAAYVTGNYRHGIGVEWSELASRSVTELFHAVTASSWVTRLASTDQTQLNFGGYI